MNQSMNRNLIIITALFFVFNLSAQTRLSVEGSGKLYQIAIPQPCAVNGDTENALQISRIISRDLELSGYFEVLNPEAFIESPGKCGDPKQFAWSDWSVLGVDGLVRGQILSNAGNIKVQLYLFDVQLQKLELAKEYSGSEDHLRPIAHRFANEIMKFFTGEFGPFGTKIAFSGKVGRFKEIFVMDLDGHDLRQLTKESSLAQSVSWNRAGSELVFANFRNRQPDMFKISLSGGSPKRITNSQAMELSPKFASDSESFLASISTGQKSDIVMINEDGKTTRNLTSNYAYIDVSPEWSPDYSRIAFVSNRGGGPQIYVMNADGSNPQRISYVSSNYCTSPAWSPKGDKIAFVCRSENRHNIFISSADGNSPVQLTAAGSNEDPSWSPDGRYLVFATNFDRDPVYNLAIIRADGSNLQQITHQRVGSQDPSWSNWLDK